MNESNGLPLAMVDMIKILNTGKVVTRSTVRDLQHGAGIKYRDWSYLFIALWGLIVGSRFIALGTHSFEGYILAGIGSSIFVALKLMLRKKG